MQSAVKNIVLFGLVGCATWWGWQWFCSSPHGNLLGTPAVESIQRYDQDLQSEIDALWQRIEVGLEKHSPKSLKLGPPATDQELERLEFELGYQIPADLKASLRVHLGSGEFLEGYSFYDVGQILETHHMYLDCASPYTPYPIKPDPADCDPFWHPGWIPIAGWDAFEIVVNLENGKVYAWMDPGLIYAAGSWKSWLTNVAVRLERNVVPAEYDNDVEYWMDSAFPTPGSDKEWK